MSEKKERSVEAQNSALRDYLYKPTPNEKDRPGRPSAEEVKVDVVGRNPHPDLAEPRELRLAREAATRRHLGIDQHIGYETCGSIYKET